MWDELEAAIAWLLHKKSEPINDYILVELGAMLPHYLDDRGYYEIRHNLSMRAKDVAIQAERPTIAIWLLCDCLPWLYSEQYNDLPTAHARLTEGIKLARDIGNIEAEALGRAFLARLYLLKKQFQAADAELSYARDLI